MAKNRKSSTETSKRPKGDQGPAQAPNVRNRSPNQPSVDLERAIELTDKIHRTYRNQAAMVNLIHKLWEYSEHSSMANQVVAALRAFGLIDTDGTGMKRSVNVSGAGERIVRGAPDSDNLIKVAALSPAIYREVWEKYNGELPHDDILRQYLVWDREHGTFNEDVVGGVIDRLRSTFSFAKISKDSIIKGNDSPEPENGDGDPVAIEVGHYVQWESQGALQFDAPRNVLGLSDDGEYAFVEGTKTGLPIGELTIMTVPEVDKTLPPANPFTEGERTVQGTKQDVFALDQGQVVVRWPSSLSQDSFSDIKEWFPILERKIGRCVRAPESDETG